MRHIVDPQDVGTIREGECYRSPGNETAILPCGVQCIGLTFYLKFTQVNAHDEDDDHVASSIERSRIRLTQSDADSPPPSFHSRASSTAPRNRRVEDPALADAFDADNSDSDDEPDDRQRLVRQNSDLAPPSISGSSTQQNTPLTGSSGASTPASRPAAVQATRTITTATTSSNRFFGSGIQNDGIFSNLSAKPERSNSEKEEQPPVRCLATLLFSCLASVSISCTTDFFGS